MFWSYIWCGVSFREDILTGKTKGFESLLYNSDFYGFIGRHFWMLFFFFRFSSFRMNGMGRTAISGLRSIIHHILRCRWMFERRQNENQMYFRKMRRRRRRNEFCICIYAHDEISNWQTPTKNIPKFSNDMNSLHCRFCTTRAADVEINQHHHSLRMHFFCGNFRWNIISKTDQPHCRLSRVKWSRNRGSTQLHHTANVIGITNGEITNCLLGYIRHLVDCRTPKSIN